MNDCMWAAFCLNEEGEKFKNILMNHQIPKRQTIVESVRTRLEHLKSIALGFCGISLWHNWDTESWIFSSRLCKPDFKISQTLPAEMANRITGTTVSVGATIRESTETDVHVFSDSVLCVGGHNAIANEA